MDSTSDILMNLEEQLIYVTKHQRALRHAIDELEQAGIPCNAQDAKFKELLVLADEYIPQHYPDEFRIRSAPLDITEHLTGDRDLLPQNLHAKSSPGRIYTLTRGQRAVLRDRAGMTPTKEVKVNEIAVWPAAPNCIRYISITSTEHVPAHRRHILNAAVIDDWVAFCTAARAIDLQNEEVEAKREAEKATDGSKSTRSGNDRIEDLFAQYGN